MSVPPETGEPVVLRIRRCADSQSPSTVEDYSVPRRRGWSVLDALQYVKDRIDPTLSFRGSCRMGICGSCGVEVDGRPVLACSTFVRDAVAPLSIEPMRHFPVERDLVVGLDDALGSLGELQTYLQPADSRGPNDPPRLQTPAQLAAYKSHAMCINCMLCYSACPQYGLDDFLGPGALALAQRYNLDSRDAGSTARLERAGAEDGVWRCTVVGTCSEVCPADVRPATAIQQLKLASVAHAVRSLATTSASPDDAPLEPPTPSVAPKRPLSRLWWTTARSYRRYMLREASAFFTAAYAVFLLYVAVVLYAGGATGVDQAMAVLTGPGALVLHVVALPFFALHAFSWMRIAPMLFRTTHPRAWTAVMLGIPVSLVLLVLLVIGGDWA